MNRAARFIGLGLVAVMTAQSVFGYLPERNVWEERRSRLEFPQKNARPLLSEKQSAETPSLFSFVRQRGDKPVAGKPAVVILEDVHLNEEAQRNMAGALTVLLKQNGDRQQIVGVEGSVGKFDFSPYRGLAAPKKIAEIANAFVKSGKIGAAVYTGLTLDKKFAAAYQPIGVETGDLYAGNVEAYRSAMDKKPRAEKELANAGRKNEDDARRTLTRSAYRFFALRRDYASGKISLGEYATKLGALSPETVMPLKLETFAAAFELERKMDWPRVDRERKELFQALASRLTEPEIAQLAAQTRKFQAHELTTGGYWKELAALMRAHGMDGKRFPTFENYLRYAFLADGVDAEALLVDLKKFEATLQASLKPTIDEKRVLDQSRALALARKLTNFELTPEEWNEYKDIFSSHENWKLKIENFESFYEFADRRSEAMVANLLANSDRSSKEKLVIVTGGFHTPTLKEIFTKKGYSVSVLTPQLSKVDTANGSAYLNVFLREKSPLQKLFAGRKLFLGLPETIGTQSKRQVEVPALRANAPLEFKAACGVKTRRFSWIQVKAATGMALSLMLAFVPSQESQSSRSVLAVVVVLGIVAWLPFIPIFLAGLLFNGSGPQQAVSELLTDYNIAFAARFDAVRRFDEPDFKRAQQEFIAAARAIRKRAEETNPADPKSVIAQWVAENPHQRETPGFFFHEIPAANAGEIMTMGGVADAFTSEMNKAVRDAIDEFIASFPPEQQASAANFKDRIEWVSMNPDDLFAAARYEDIFTASRKRGANTDFFRQQMAQQLLIDTDKAKNDGKLDCIQLGHANPKMILTPADPAAIRLTVLHELGHGFGRLGLLGVPGQSEWISEAFEISAFLQLLGKPGGLSAEEQSRLYFKTGWEKIVEDARAFVDAHPAWETLGSTGERIKQKEEIESLVPKSKSSDRNMRELGRYFGAIETLRAEGTAATADNPNPAFRRIIELAGSPLARLSEKQSVALKPKTGDEIRNLKSRLTAALGRKSGISGWSIKKWKRKYAAERPRWHVTVEGNAGQETGTLTLPERDLFAVDEDGLELKALVNGRVAAEQKNSVIVGELAGNGIFHLLWGAVLLMRAESYLRSTHDAALKAAADNEYPNAASVFAADRFRKNPIYLQLIDTLLYQTRQGTNDDPRLGSLRVREALEKIRSDIDGLLAMDTVENVPVVDTEKALELVTQKVWPVFQELYKRSEDAVLAQQLLDMSVRNPNWAKRHNLLNFIRGPRGAGLYAGIAEDPLELAREKALEEMLEKARELDEEDRERLQQEMAEALRKAEEEFAAAMGQAGEEAEKLSQEKLDKLELQSRLYLWISHLQAMLVRIPTIQNLLENMGTDPRDMAPQPMKEEFEQLKKEAITMDGNARLFLQKLAATGEDSEEKSEEIKKSNEALDAIGAKSASLSTGIQAAPFHAPTLLPTLSDLKTDVENLLKELTPKPEESEADEADEPPPAPAPDDADDTGMDDEGQSSKGPEDLPEIPDSPTTFLLDPGAGSRGMDAAELKWWTEFMSPVENIKDDFKKHFRATLRTALQKRKPPKHTRSGPIHSINRAVRGAAFAIKNEGRTPKPSEVLEFYLMIVFDGSRSMIDPVDILTPSCRLGAALVMALLELEEEDEFKGKIVFHTDMRGYALVEKDPIFLSTPKDPFNEKVLARGLREYLAQKKGATNDVGAVTTAMTDLRAMAEGQPGHIALGMVHITDSNGRANGQADAIQTVLSAPENQSIYSLHIGVGGDAKGVPTVYVNNNEREHPNTFAAYVPNIAKPAPAVANAKAMIDNMIGAAMQKPAVMHRRTSALLATAAMATLLLVSVGVALFDGGMCFVVVGSVLIKIWSKLKGKDEPKEVEFLLQQIENNFVAQNLADGSTPLALPIRTDTDQQVFSDNGVTYRLEGHQLTAEKDGVKIEAQWQGDKWLWLQHTADAVAVLLLPAEFPDWFRPAIGNAEGSCNGVDGEPLFAGAFQPSTETREPASWKWRVVKKDIKVVAERGADVPVVNIVGRTVTVTVHGHTDRFFLTRTTIVNLMRAMKVLSYGNLPSTNLRVTGPDSIDKNRVLTLLAGLLKQPISIVSADADMNDQTLVQQEGLGLFQPYTTGFLRSRIFRAGRRGEWVVFSNIHNLSNPVATTAFTTFLQDRTIDGHAVPATFRFIATHDERQGPSFTAAQHFLSRLRSQPFDHEKVTEEAYSMTVQVMGPQPQGDEKAAWDENYKIAQSLAALAKRVRDYHASNGVSSISTEQLVRILSRVRRFPEDKPYLRHLFELEYPLLAVPDHERENFETELENWWGDDTVFGKDGNGEPNFYKTMGNDTRDPGKPRYVKRGGEYILECGTAETGFVSLSLGRQPPSAAIPDFEWTLENRQMILWVLKDIEQGHSFFVVGRPSTGKTHLMNYILNRLLMWSVEDSGLPLVPQSTTEHLVGAQQINDIRSIFPLPPLFRGLRHGRVVRYEEITSVPAEVVESLRNNKQGLSTVFHTVEAARPGFLLIGTGMVAAADTGAFRFVQGLVSIHQPPAKTEAGMVELIRERARIMKGDHETLTPLTEDMVRALARTAMLLERNNVDPNFRGMEALIQDLMRDPAATARTIEEHFLNAYSILGTERATVEPLLVYLSSLRLNALAGEIVLNQDQEELRRPIAELCGRLAELTIREHLAHTPFPFVPTLSLMNQIAATLRTRSDECLTFAGTLKVLRAALKISRGGTVTEINDDQAETLKRALVENDFAVIAGRKAREAYAASTIAEIKKFHGEMALHPDLLPALERFVGLAVTAHEQARLPIFDKNGIKKTLDCFQPTTVEAAGAPFTYLKEFFPGTALDNAALQEINRESGLADIATRLAEEAQWQRLNSNDAPVSEQLEVIWGVLNEAWDEISGTERSAITDEAKAQSWDEFKGPIETVLLRFVAFLRSLPSKSKNQDTTFSPASITQDTEFQKETMAKQGGWYSALFSRGPKNYPKAMAFMKTDREPFTTEIMYMKDMSINVAEGSWDRRVDYIDMTSGKTHLILGSVSQNALASFDVTSGNVTPITDLPTGLPSDAMVGLNGEKNFAMFVRDQDRIALSFWDWIGKKDIDVKTTNLGDMPNGIRVAAFSHDQNRLALGIAGAVVLCTCQPDGNGYRLTDFRRIELKGEVTTVSSLLFSADGTLLTVATGNGNIHFVDVASGNALPKKIKHSTHKILSMRFEDEEQTLAVVGVGSEFTKWRIKPGQKPSPLHAFLHTVLEKLDRAAQEALRAVKKRIDPPPPPPSTASAKIDLQKLRILEIKPQDVQFSDVVIDRDPAHNVTAFDVSPSGRFLATAVQLVSSRDSVSDIVELRLLDRESGDLHSLLSVERVPSDPITHVRFGSTGRFLAVVLESGGIQIRRLDADGKEEKMWTYSIADTVTAVEFGLNDTRLVVGTDTGFVHVWDLTRPDEQKALHEGYTSLGIRAITCSNDYIFVATDHPEATLKWSSFGLTLNTGQPPIKAYMLHPLEPRVDVLFESGKGDIGNGEKLTIHASGNIEGMYHALGDVFVTIGTYGTLSIWNGDRTGKTPDDPSERLLSKVVFPTNTGTPVMLKNVRVTPDGTIFLLNEDNKLSSWKMPTIGAPNTPANPPSGVQQLITTPPDDLQLTPVEFDGEEAKNVKAFDVSPDGKFVAEAIGIPDGRGGLEAEIVIADRVTGKITFKNPAISPIKDIKGLFFAEYGERFAVHYQDAGGTELIDIYTLENGKWHPVPLGPMPAPVTALAFHPTTFAFVTAHTDSRMRVWTYQTYAPVMTHEENLGGPHVESIQAHADGLFCSAKNVIAKFGWDLKFIRREPDRSDPNMTYLLFSDPTHRFRVIRKGDRKNIREISGSDQLVFVQNRQVTLADGNSGGKKWIKPLTEDPKDARVTTDGTLFVLQEDGKLISSRPSVKAPEKKTALPEVELPASADKVKFEKADEHVTAFCVGPTGLEVKAIAKPGQDPDDRVLNVSIGSFDLPLSAITLTIEKIAVSGGDKPTVALGFSDGSVEIYRKADDSSYSELSGISLNGSKILSLAFNDEGTKLLVLTEQAKEPHSTESQRILSAWEINKSSLAYELKKEIKNPKFQQVQYQADVFLVAFDNKLLEYEWKENLTWPERATADKKITAFTPFGNSTIALGLENGRVTAPFTDAKIKIAYPHQNPGAAVLDMATSSDGETLFSIGKNNLVYGKPGSQWVTVPLPDSPKTLHVYPDHLKVLMENGDLLRWQFPKKENAPDIILKALAEMGTVLAGAAPEPQHESTTNELEKIKRTIEGNPSRKIDIIENALSKDGFSASHWAVSENQKYAAVVARKSGGTPGIFIYDIGDEPKHLVTSYGLGFGINSASSPDNVAFWPGNDINIIVRYPNGYVYSYKPTIDGTGIDIRPLQLILPGGTLASPNLLALSQKFFAVVHENRLTVFNEQGLEIHEFPETDPIGSSCYSNAAVFSNDGTKLAIANSHGVVRIWNVQNMRSPKLLDEGKFELNTTLSETITTLKFSPLWNHLAIGTSRGSKCLWKFNTVFKGAGPAKLVATPSRGAPINQFEFIDRFQYVVVRYNVGQGKTMIGLWDHTTESVINATDFQHISYSNEKNTLSSISNNGILREWDLSALPTSINTKIQESLIAADYYPYLNFVQVSRDGTRVAFRALRKNEPPESKKSTLFIYDARTGEHVDHFENEDGVKPVTFTESNEVVYTTSDSTGILKKNSTTGLLQAIGMYSEAVADAAHTSKIEVAALGSTLRIQNLTGPHTIPEDAPISVVDVSADGGKVAIGDTDGNVRIIKSDLTGTLMNTKKRPGQTRVTTIRLGNLGMVYQREGQAPRFCIAGRIHPLDFPTENIPTIFAFEFLEGTGDTYIIGVTHGDIFIWKLGSDKIVKRIRLPSYPADFKPVIKYSADRFGVVLKNGTILQWNLADLGLIPKMGVTAPAAMLGIGGATLPWWMNVIIGAWVAYYYLPVVISVVKNIFRANPAAAVLNQAPASVSQGLTGFGELAFVQRNGSTPATAVANVIEVNDIADVAKLSAMRPHAHETTFAVARSPELADAAHAALQTSPADVRVSFAPADEIVDGAAVIETALAANDPSLESLAEALVRGSAEIRLAAKTEDWTIGDTIRVGKTIVNTDELSIKIYLGKLLMRVLKKLDAKRKSAGEFFEELRKARDRALVAA